MELTEEHRAAVREWIAKVNGISKAITALNTAVQTMNPDLIGDKAAELMLAIDAEKPMRDTFIDATRLAVGKSWKGFMS